MRISLIKEIEMNRVGVVGAGLDLGKRKEDG